MATTARSKKPAIPSSPAKCADLLYKTRQERLELEREVAKLQALESTLKDFFINSLSKDSTGVAGQVARVQVTSKVVPIVEDWDKFYAHVRKTGQFDLMQKRLSTTAVEERWEQVGKKGNVPGVGRLHAKNVSCTVLKQK